MLGPQAGGDEIDDLSRAEEDHPMVLGVVTMRIRNATQLHAHDPRLLDGRTPTGLQVVVTCRNFTKRTHLAHTESNSCIWDEIKHIPVVVIRRRKHPFNAVRVGLVAKGVGKNAPEEEIGSLGFHLHEIAESSPISGTFSIFRGHHDVGLLDMDIFFQYGMYGYGYSPKLITGSSSMDRHLLFSLYPRVQPPQHRVEPTRQVLVPSAVPHPSALVEFDEQVEIGPSVDVKRNNPNFYASDANSSMVNNHYNNKNSMNGNDNDDIDDERLNAMRRSGDAQKERFASVIASMSDDFSAMRARLRELKPQGGRERKARLEFLHQRIEATTKKAEAARTSTLTALNLDDPAIVGEQRLQQLQMEMLERQKQIYQMQHQQQQQQQQNQSQNGSGGDGLSWAIDVNGKSTGSVSSIPPPLVSKQGSNNNNNGNDYGNDNNNNDNDNNGSVETGGVLSEEEMRQQLASDILSGQIDPESRFFDTMRHNQTKSLLSKLPSTYARFLKPAKQVVALAEAAEVNSMGTGQAEFVPGEFNRQTGVHENGNQQGASRPRVPPLMLGRNQTLGEFNIGSNNNNGNINNNGNHNNNRRSQFRHAQSMGSGLRAGATLDHSNGNSSNNGNNESAQSLSSGASRRRGSFYATANLRRTSSLQQQQQSQNKPSLRPSKLTPVKE